MCVAGTRITQEGVDSMETKNQDRISELVEKQKDTYTSMADEIWGYAEPRFQEYESSRVQQEYLASRGFSIRADLAGEKTAFIAEWGSGKPVLAFLGEFDALFQSSAGSRLHGASSDRRKNRWTWLWPPSSRNGICGGCRCTKVLYGRKRPEGNDPLLWLSGGGECGRKGISGPGRIFQ